MNAPLPLPVTSPPLRRRVLLVDDNPAIHEDFHKVLRAEEPPSALDEVMAAAFGDRELTDEASAFFDITSALSGEEALGKVQQALAEGDPFLLAFVDVRMPPGWDGVETVLQLWQADARLQVVICTAYSDYSWRGMVKRLGHTDRLVILKKPFDSVEVLQLAHAMSRKWLVSKEAEDRLKEVEQLSALRAQKLRENELLTAQLRREMMERAEAQRLLANSEERLRSAFDVCPLPVAILDLSNHHCEHANCAFLEATGRSPEEVLGHSLQEVGIHAEEECCRRAFENVRRGESLRRYECEFVTARGELRRGLLWLEPFRLADEQHALLILQDVTEQQMLEMQLRQSQKMEAVGQLAAGIAHDFNNLLTVIQGHASLHMHAAELLEPKVAVSIKEMHMAASRAAELTRQILAFSRKQVMQMCTLLIDEVVESVNNLIRRLLPATIDLFVHRCPEPLAVRADKCNLEQVLINLVVNARDAMPRGGTMTIRLEPVILDIAAAQRSAEARAGTFVRLSVADSGVGIPPEALSKIYEPFYTTKEVGKGTGMGLSVVHGIVKQHEGWIEVESQVNRGTSFYVFLPTVALPEAPSRETAPLPAGNGHGETILLAEDDDDVRRLAVYILESCDYRVLSAADGNEALQLWREHAERIDLLLTDMVMPGGISGKELAAKLKAFRPTLPIIFTSGYSVDLIQDGLGVAEEVNYLPKPYLARELTDAVSRVLARAERQ